MKKIFIAILISIVYSSECSDYNNSNGTQYNCDCNESTWQSYYNSSNHNMEGCWLKSADFDFVSLADANLQNSYLFGISINQSSLANANLAGSNMNNALIIDTFCEDAIFDNINQNTNGYIYIYSSNLERASFIGANLKEGQFNSNNLTEVNFSNAILGSSDDSFEINYSDEYMDNILLNANLCNIQVSPNGETCLISIEDNNEDGYDDSSYSYGYFVGQEAGFSYGYNTGYDLGAISGDANLDGTLDILDIVLFVDAIMNP